MEQLGYIIAGLACPVGMGLMMWMMMRGGHKDRSQGTSGDHLTPEEKLAVLQERQKRLDAEIRELAESEAQPSRN